MDQKFKQDLIKIVLDKLLFGLVIVVIGFLGKTMLEDYKAKQVFLTELKTIRVQKTSEVWEAVDQFELQSIIFRYTVEDTSMESTRGYGYADELRARQQRLEARLITTDSLHTEAQQIVFRNRIWIGDKQLNSILAYMNLILDANIAKLNSDTIALSNSFHLIDSTRRVLDSMRINY